MNGQSKLKTERMELSDCFLSAAWIIVREFAVSTRAHFLSIFYATLIPLQYGKNHVLFSHEGTVPNTALWSTNGSHVVDHTLLTLDETTSQDSRREWAPRSQHDVIKAGALKDDPEEEIVLMAHLSTSVY